MELSLETGDVSQNDDVVTRHQHAPFVRAFWSIRRSSVAVNLDSRFLAGAVRYSARELATLRARDTDDVKGTKIAFNPNDARRQETAFAIQDGFTRAGAYYHAPANIGCISDPSSLPAHAR